jgi:hypothetical protein
MTTEYKAFRIQITLHVQNTKKRNSSVSLDTTENNEELDAKQL